MARLPFESCSCCSERRVFIFQPGAGRSVFLHERSEINCSPNPCFESLNQRDHRDWQPMAIFVLEKAASTAVYRRIELNGAELEEEIGNLKSVRGNSCNDVER
jgi:hypothetical protein